MKIKKKILFCFITLVAVFLIIELSFRIIFFTKYHKYKTSVYVQGSSLQMADDTLIFRNRPFYLDKNKQYQFNCEGFKSAAGDVEMPVKSPEDFWVFLFGASAMETMGSNKDGEWLDITGVRDYPYNESIAFLLQQQLQLKMKDKRVRVFCAANSSFCVYQSYLQYRRLKKKYKMDWVISMDGNNEPMITNPDSSIREYMQSDWDNYPIFQFPLKYIIPLTQRSAFVNSLKLSLFEMKMNRRLDKAKKEGYPAKTKWLSGSGSLVYDTASAIAARSVDSFFYYIKVFDQELSGDNIPHLLFVQPHLTLKDTLKMNDTERALLHYFESTPYNEGSRNVFMKSIHRKAAQYGDTGSIRSLGFMQSDNFQTFVDYCHFSSQAIAQVVNYFANNILEQYNSVKHQ